MSVVEIKKDGTVAVIKMTNGANKHNMIFQESMNNALDAVVGDESITAAVVTSTDSKNWSQGIDLDWLMKQISENNTDSLKNCLINCDFFAPITFRIPTSLSRFAARTVMRFI